MQQFLSVWSALTLRRQIVTAAATLAMFAAVLGLTRMAATPDKSLLYSGLENSAAGQVISALEQRGVDYDVRGASIFVDSSKRDELRMALAGEGLPANGSAGYELLDSLTGFGTTSQMFDAAYWRAKEGELARTIVASPQIRSARVHLSNTSSSPFQRNLKSSASVTVLANSGAISSERAKALTYLVASAVAGLDPSDVSIIDGNDGRVVATDDMLSISGGQTSAEELKNKVQRLLEARVGYGNAVVEVSVEKVTERESIVERRFDPNGRVAISSDTEERTSNAQDAGGSAVTVASNLPEGGGSSERNSNSQNSETRERLNYEVSETQREVLRTPGAIKRITVAVLVDGQRIIDDAGQPVWTARGENELAALRDLVASAVGFQEERGDVITLKSLEFEALPATPENVAPGFLSRVTFDLMMLVQLAVLALVALILGLFVVRPILASRNISTLTEAPMLGAPASERFDGAQKIRELRPPQSNTTTNIVTTPGPASQTTQIVNAGPGALPELPGQIGNMAVAEFDVSDAPASGMDAALSPSAGAVSRLRQLIDERQDETVEILKDWMQEGEHP